MDNILFYLSEVVKMIKLWLLIIVFNGSDAFIKTIPFSTQQQCIVAGDFLKKNHKASYSYSYTCVEQTLPKEYLKCQ